MSERYGAYPIKGESLLTSPEATMAYPGATLRHRQLCDEYPGCGFDYVEKVAAVDQLWSSPDPWPQIAVWCGRALLVLGWRAFAGDEFRKASAWPWEIEADRYTFERDQEELWIFRQPNPEQLAPVTWDPSLRSFAADTWYELLIKAWSKDHDRYGGLPRPGR